MLELLVLKILLLKKKCIAIIKGNLGLFGKDGKSKKPYFDCGPSSRTNKTRTERNGKACDRTRTRLCTSY